MCATLLNRARFTQDRALLYILKIPEHVAYVSMTDTSSNPPLDSDPLRTRVKEAQER